MMDRKDWTLLAISAADAKGLTPVQLQKVLFLLGREMEHELGGDFYHFRPYHYGPFDRAVYGDAEKLSNEDAVEINQRVGENWNRYVISNEGREQADFVKKRASAGAVEYLNRIVEWALRQSFPQLVNAIYTKYPDMKVNSVFNK
jgi:hypothetical protein